MRVEFDIALRDCRRALPVLIQAAGGALPDGRRSFPSLVFRNFLRSDEGHPPSRCAGADPLDAICPGAPAMTGGTGGVRFTVPAGVQNAGTHAHFVVAAASAPAQPVPPGLWVSPVSAIGELAAPG